ncbi:diaminopimelate epimerase [Liquorilactobacillus capillatus]|uniref:Diaminopimelate epimerase n=1 Tax=Liquorilactobacillus capillatus DSM 19910 TaxID=1423731 RepID=A0A0R1M184_9LACO|nr:diaminopimelate epimerase [Liquorilactobacillus capillatus]KRL01409.1 diaminopimelate epimerase [Liquorilactobacillus capillatus DSM 19910]
MKMLKVHGSNNDFFILDGKNLDKQLTEAELSILARKVCDRKVGLHGGADGILFVTASGHTGVVGKMRVINADGSEASMCGNGIRTVARYLSEREHAAYFKIETMYADLEVKKATPFAPDVQAFDAEISPVSFDAVDLKMHLAGKTKLVNDYIPELSETLKFSAVAVPNPHLIAFVSHDVLTGPELGRIAAYLNNGQNLLFPDGVNVSFVEIQKPRQIFVRTYERGVGYTNACGTAMSASSLMYALLYPEQVKLEDLISVFNPGGMVKTRVHQRTNGAYWMSLIGNATFVATVEVAQSAALEGDFKDISWKETGEQAAYEDFATAISKGEQE